MPNDFVIETSQLRKVYRDFWRRPVVEAVKSLDLTVRRGEVFGLLGPNGSGKSTTLKLLLGLIRPSAGTIRVLGLPPTHVATKARIGYLPELSHLHPFLTPRETLRYYAALFGLSPRESEMRTTQLLDMVGLTHAADRAAGQFSKGMARRVGLAQALINAPDLLILDEPTSGLDPEACRDMKDLVLTLKQAGVTVVMTSHLLADVEDVCDRVAILAGGICRAEGSVADLLRVPDAVRFEIDGLSPEQTAAARHMLAATTGRTVHQNFPTLTLEAFFLKVVAPATSDGASRFAPAPFLVKHTVASEP